MTTSFLLEGGVAGHMSHLYDNYGLSFSQLKDVFTAAADGKLEGTEKTDGQNLFISFDVNTGTAKGARNKGNIKDGGLTAQQLASKFGGRGPLEFTFTEALKAFEEAVQLFTPVEQEEIFGPNTNIYYNCEIQDPRTANVINYDIKTLSIHRLGGAEFDRETGDKTDRDVTENAEKLDKALQRVQDQKKGDYKVQFDAIRRLQALDDRTVLDNAIDRVEAAINQYGISDNQTIGDYVVARIEKLIDDQVDVPDEIKASVIKRVLGSKEVKLQDLKKQFASLPPETVDVIMTMIKEPGSVLTNAIRPIEEIVHDFSVEMLKTLESAFVVDNKKEVERLRSELQRAISAIEASDSSEAMSILKKQMEKLKSVENVSTAAEGFVFAYDGHSYKFTGNFAPMNQLLGLFKYGRGNVPPLQKLDETLMVEIVEEETQTIALFGGSFKPPHKGHMAVVEYLAERFDKVIVFISEPKRQENIRMKLSADDAAQIFNLYINDAGLSDVAVAQASPLPSPLTSVYTFAEKANFSPRAKVFLATSTKDADRFPRSVLDKQKQKNPTVESLETVIVPAIGGPQGEVSAKQLRAIIADKSLSREDKEEELLSYLPEFLEEGTREMVYNLLMPEEMISEIRFIEIITEKTLGLHGAGMKASDLPFGDEKPELNKADKVTPEEAALIAKKIKDEKPERIFAYSRGSAVLNKAIGDHNLDSGKLPPVTYVAPAALRGWTDAEVPQLPAGSETFIGDKDAAVPVKQACKIAKAAGTSLNVFPDKSHVSAMYAVKNGDPSYEIDIDACLSDSEMPDWGTNKIAKEDPLVAQQQQQTRKLSKTPIPGAEKTAQQTLEEIIDSEIEKALEGLRKKTNSKISKSVEDEEILEMSAMGGGAVQGYSGRKDY